MAKKCKCRPVNGLPKRIAGMRIPKSVRRAAGTPLGSALIAEFVVSFARDAAASQPVRRAAADLRAQFARAALGVAEGVQDAANAAGDSLVDAARERPRRARALRDDEMTH